jgi:hypothetical protein
MLLFFLFLNLTFNFLLVVCSTHNVVASVSVSLLFVCSIHNVVASVSLLRASCVGSTMLLPLYLCLVRMNI